MKLTFAALKDSRILTALALLAVLGLTAGEAFASLCVWRNPGADIQEIFGGGSYRTVVVNVGGHKSAIEQAIGTSLDADETQLKFLAGYQERPARGHRRLAPGQGRLRRDRGDRRDRRSAERARECQGSEDPARPRAIPPAASQGCIPRPVQGEAAASSLTVGDDIAPAHPNAIRSSEVVALSVTRCWWYEKLSASPASSSADNPV